MWTDTITLPLFVCAGHFLHCVVVFAEPFLGILCPRWNGRMQSSRLHHGILTGTVGGVHTYFLRRRVCVAWSCLIKTFVWMCMQDSKYPHHHLLVMLLSNLSVEETNAAAIMREGQEHQVDFFYLDCTKASDRLTRTTNDASACVYIPYHWPVMTYSMCMYLYMCACRS